MHRGGQRAPAARRRALVMVLAVAGVAASCTGAAGAPTSTGAAAVPAALARIERVVDRLLPPVPSPLGAGMLPAGCDAADLNPPSALPPVTARWRGPGGLYLRRYGGTVVEESTVPFDTPPTPAQSAAAKAFVARVRAVIRSEGWDDPATVIRDGFRPMQPCSSHYVNVANLFDGRQLDPERPPFVVMAVGPGGRLHIRAVMYLAPTPEAVGPQPFGTLALWHYHEIPMCLIAGQILVDQGTTHCPSGTELFARSPAMLHVTVSGAPFNPLMTI